MNLFSVFSLHIRNEPFYRIGILPPDILPPCFALLGKRIAHVSDQVLSFPIPRKISPPVRPADFHKLPPSVLRIIFSVSANYHQPDHHQLCSVPVCKELALLLWCFVNRTRPDFCPLLFQKNTIKKNTGKIRCPLVSCVVSSLLFCECQKLSGLIVT